MIPWLTRDMPFPPAAEALREPNGLLAAGADLSVPRLLQAYRQGIFPWFGPQEPILWWSPDPRMVLLPSEFHVSHSLRKILRKGRYELRIDTCFEQVMRACAAPRATDTGTWIGEEMIAAYCELHRQGYAHTVEVWMDGELAGGLYGVSLGRVFFGESMFSRRTDASKIALAHLSAQLARWHFGLIDCQMHTPHLASLGARTIPRSTYLARLTELLDYPPVPDWRFADDLFR